MFVLFMVVALFTTSSHSTPCPVNIDLQSSVNNFSKTYHRDSVCQK